MIIKQMFCSPNPVLQHHKRLLPDCLHSGSSLRMMYQTRLCSGNTVHAPLLTPLPSDLQPVGRAFALVQPASDRTTPNPEPVKSTVEQVEVIKVSVKDRLLVQIGNYMFLLVCQEGIYS